MARTKDVSVTIHKDKVYSSYYARACKIVPDRRLVAISIGIPDNFGGAIMRELNPPQWLLYKYKNGQISEADYKEAYYNEVLNKLNPKEIYEKLKGKVILCYCGQDKFCHRHLVIEWLRDNLGEDTVGNDI